MIDDARASRLLAASWYVYYAGGEPNQPTALSGRVAHVGYLPNPKYVFSGTGYGWLGPLATLMPGAFIPFPRRDAATIGVTPSEIVVAFRGTLPPETTDQATLAVDWLNNALTTLKPRDKLPGRVHTGFTDAVFALWSKVMNVLEPLLKSHPTLPVCFTGHSKGGAMALLAAARFKAEGHDRPALVCTFAAPRAGDAVFVEGLESAVADCRRYEYGNDPVPHLPINGAPPHFAPAGKLYYLGRLADGAATAGLQPSGEGLGATATEALLAQIILDGTAGRFDPGGDHRIAPPAGYERWVHRA